MRVGGPVVSYPERHAAALQDDRDLVDEAGQDHMRRVDQGFGGRIEQRAVDLDGVVLRIITAHQRHRGGRDGTEADPLRPGLDADLPADRLHRQELAGAVIGAHLPVDGGFPMIVARPEADGLDRAGGTVD